MLKIRASCLVAIVALVFSCLNEDIDRTGECDGSLAIAVSERKSPSSCNDLGTIRVVASGGVPPYKFSHNGLPFQDSGTFNDVPSGDHSIAVLDANECTALETDIIINQPPNSTIALGISGLQNDNSCQSGNGQVTLVGSGGIGTLLYSFNGSTFSSQTTYAGLEVGMYDARVKDDGGCIASKSVEIKRASTGTSWVVQVKPLLADRCVKCHPGSGTTDNWGSYASVFAKRESIKSYVAVGAMPPSPETPLTAAEKAIILCWIDDGAPDN